MPTRTYSKTIDASSITCTYVDHLEASGHTLGRLYTDRAGQPRGLDKEAMDLQTCHRTEFYAMADHPVPTWFPEARTLSGTKAVANRIACIAAGAESVLPGDSLVLGQVVHSACSVSASSSVRRVAFAAISLGLDARRNFDLCPVADYADLPGVLNDGATRGRTLMVLGGGTLAQSVLENSGRAYEHKIAFTNDPPRMRATLATSAGSADTTVVSVGELANYEPDTTFDLVFATAGKARSSTLMSLRRLTAHTSHVSTTDLCALPYMPMPSNSDEREFRYRHILEADVIKIMREVNSDVAARAKAASAWIGKMVEERLLEHRVSA